MNTSLVDKWMSTKHPAKNSIIMVLKETPMNYEQLGKTLPHIPAASLRRNLSELKAHDVVIQAPNKKWHIVIDE